LAGEPRAIARAMSVVEDETPDAAALIGQIYPRTGRAYLIGITGAPGTGKSTLVDALTGEIRRAGQTVGIIAVDPTSPFTGGAILGDRVRMTGHAGDAGVYIRSMATRGHLGGLSRATGDVALVLDAAGTDVVIIETVGVGQDEVDIVRTADVSIVVVVPGAGDDVQAIKAGIMEIGDIFVVNKADREGADRAAQAIAANLSLHTFAAGEWKPPIVMTEATRPLGVDELWRQIGRYREHMADRQADRRRERQRFRLRDLLARTLVQQVEASLPADEIDRMAEKVAARELDPYAAVADMIESAGRGRPSGRPAL
jgi:LAO/AO transport system kinase